MADILINVTTEQLEDMALNGLKMSDVEQKYDPKSEKPQSGVAVAQAMADVVQTVKPINLFDKGSTLNQDGYVIQSRGALTPASGFTVSHPIKAEKGTYTYHISKGLGANAIRVGKADETGAYFDFIKANDNGDNTATFTIDDSFDGVYFMVHMYNPDIDTFMVVKGNTMPSDYVPYFEPYAKLNDSVELPSFVLTKSFITNTTGDSENKVMSQKAVTDEFNLIRKNFIPDKKYNSTSENAQSGLAVAEAIDSVVQTVEPINLFDKDNTFNQDGYIIQSRGALTPLNNFTVSHPIKAEKGVSYTFLTNATQLGVNAIRVGKADETGAYFDFIKANDNGDNTATFTIDDSFDGAYFMVHMYNPNIDNFMVVKGDTMPNEYVPHTSSYRKLAEDIDITANLKDLELGGTGNKPNTNTSVSPLYGKKISLNGDSICYGAGATGGYGKIIADTYDMTLQNIARSGGTIAAETYKPDGGSRHWICRTIANMDADSDYAIVEGGVNDASPSVGVPLGTLSTGYSATLDDTTFYGAFESMCKQLLVRFAGKKVGYIAVHKMIDTYSSSGDEATNYYWASKKCCEKWGIPFLDLNIACPPFGLIFPSNTEMYPLRENYTSSADGWHPNEEGYKKYYVPKIVAWLKSLGEDENSVVLPGVSTETLNQIEAQLDEIIDLQEEYIERGNK